MLARYVTPFVLTFLTALTLAAVLGAGPIALLVLSLLAAIPPLTIALCPPGSADPAAADSAASCRRSE